MHLTRGVVPFIFFTHSQRPGRITCEKDCLGRKGELDALLIEPSEDLLVKTFPKGQEFPVVWRMVPVDDQEIKGVRIEIGEIDPGRQFFVHSLVVCQEFLEDFKGFVDLLRRGVIGNGDVGGTFDERALPDVLYGLVGELFEGPPAVHAVEVGFEEVGSSGHAQSSII